MFKLFKRTRSQSDAIRELPQYRTLTTQSHPGQMWRELGADFLAIAEKIKEPMIAVAQESDGHDQRVALFTHPDLFVEDFETLTLTPDVLLLKTAGDTAWQRLTRQPDIRLPKAALRHPNANSWEVFADGVMRRGQIFLQSRHLLAAPFKRHL